MIERRAPSGNKYSLRRVLLAGALMAGGGALTVSGIEQTQIPAHSIQLKYPDRQHVSSLDLNSRGWVGVTVAALGLVAIGVPPRRKMA